MNWKRITQVISNRNLYLYTVLDISKNKLRGEIPTSLGNLKTLELLNLSYNDISGSIPQSFGGLDKLEILDVSYNNLSGKIPRTLSRLSELDVLDLSNNMLSGRIPESPQLDRLNDPNIYANNSKICGMQIQVSCSTTRTEQQPNEEEEEKEATVPWEAVVVGCSCGFLTSVLLMYTVGYFRDSPPRRSPKNRGFKKLRRLH